MLDPSVLAFVLEALPPPPSRVLEVGAGQGELAAELRRSGYEVLAIDPATQVGGVRPVSLNELEEPDAGFDAALAVVSLHHLDPLPDSCQRLGQMVRPGGKLVLDEFDVERLDERAARWWLDRAGASAHRGRTPTEVITEMRHHCHSLRAMESALAGWFELSPPSWGPYLYRWDLPLALRGQEEELIANGGLPATGARIVGTRRGEVSG